MYFVPYESSHSHEYDHPPHFHDYHHHEPPKKHIHHVHIHQSPGIVKLGQVAPVAQIAPIPHHPIQSLPVQTHIIAKEEKDKKSKNGLSLRRSGDSLGGLRPGTFGGGTIKENNEVPNFRVNLAPLLTRSAVVQSERNNLGSGKSDEIYASVPINQNKTHLDQLIQIQKRKPSTINAPRNSVNIIDRGAFNLREGLKNFNEGEAKSERNANNPELNQSRMKNLTQIYEQMINLQMNEKTFESFMSEQLDLDFSDIENIVERVKTFKNNTNFLHGKHNENHIDVNGSISLPSQDRKRQNFEPNVQMKMYRVLNKMKNYRQQSNLRSIHDLSQNKNGNHHFNQPNNFRFIHNRNQHKSGNNDNNQQSNFRFIHRVNQNKSENHNINLEPQNINISNSQTKKNIVETFMSKQLQLNLPNIDNDLKREQKSLNTNNSESRQNLEENIQNYVVTTYKPDNKIEKMSDLIQNNTAKLLENKTKSSIETFVSKLLEVPFQEPGTNNSEAHPQSRFIRNHFRVERQYDDYFPVEDFSETVNSFQHNLDPFFQQYQTGKRYHDVVPSLNYELNTQQGYEYQPSEAIIHKHVSVHVAPEFPEDEVKQRPVMPQTPEKHYKIIFIKAPDLTPKPVQLAQPQVQKEEKTLVYVLVKKPVEEQQPEFVPTEAPHLDKPEVYFIPYKNVYDKDGAGELGYNNEPKSNGHLEEQIRFSNDDILKHSNGKSVLNGNGLHNQNENFFTNAYL